MALGIGANSTIFTFTNAYLLRPLPFKDSGRIRIVQSVDIPSQRVSRSPMYGEAVAWRDAAKTVDGVVAARFLNFNTTETIPPEQVLGMQVSPGFFELLSVQPHMGRSFTPEDDTPGRSRVVAVSYSFWQRTGARPDVLGKTLHLNGEPYTVVAVMPASFRFPSPEWELWTPLGLAADEAGKQQSVNVMFRTRPGVAAQAASAELGEIARRLVRSDSAKSGGWAVMSWSLHDFLNHVPQAAPSILALQVAALFVLLIACANLANILLARANARRKEIAIRIAIGAGRSQLLKQLLIEACLLSICGGVAGTALAYAANRALVAVCPTWMLPAEGVGIDASVLLFTAAASVAAGLVFGIAPALHASRGEQVDALKQGGRSEPTVAHQGLRRSLVIAEMAASVVLVIGAALLIRTLHGSNSDLGFRTADILTLQTTLPAAKYGTPGAVAGFYEQALDSVANTPGIISAGARAYLRRAPVTAAGQVPAEAEAELRAFVVAVTRDYFSTLGIPLRSGRAFSSSDSSGSQQVAIVNDSFAKRMWPGQSAVGQSVRVGARDLKTVVGVVGDTKVNPLEVARLELYVPHRQESARTMQLVVRTARPPAQLANSVRLAVAAVDPHQAVTNVRTMDDSIAFEVSPQRVTSGLMAVFAAVAVLLAVIGIYGVMAYSVSQRTHEFGVRMALGAPRMSIAQLVLREAGLMALAGIAVGLAASFVLTRLMKAILYGISATDPLTFLAVPLTLAMVAAAAACIPALRATGADPLNALRCE